MKRPKLGVRESADYLNLLSTYVTNMSLAQFTKNELVIDAVVRNFEIIGEASRSIPVKIRQSHPDIPWDQMSGMRNVLIHEYFGVDVQTVWHTTKRHLPSLRKHLEAILSHRSSCTT